TTRPRDIRLDGLDPCALFTPEVRAKLGTDRPPRFAKGPSPVFQGEVPACDVLRFSAPSFNVSVSFVLHDGVDLYRPERVQGMVAARAVHGFPALLLTPSRYRDSCAVAIDIAPGQLISILYGDGGGTPPIPQPQLCAGAELTADLTMSALLAQV
ncbi:MAG: DUF3558 domain-containing protein, partial [Actinomycetia bacterium]|nr:DUF3558 domain-containing protein [Actinomycetes bacterium]